MLKRQGQSILEYVIVLTVIVTAIIIAANSFVKPAVESSMNKVGQSVESATDKLPGVTASP